MGDKIEIPSPLAGEGGPQGRMRGLPRSIHLAAKRNGQGRRDPSSVGFADTFSRKGRRILARV
jgi:hypothetical protein